MFIFMFHQKREFDYGGCQFRFHHVAPSVSGIGATLYFEMNDEHTRIHELLEKMNYWSEHTKIIVQGLIFNPFHHILLSTHLLSFRHVMLCYVTQSGHQESSVAPV